VFISQALRLCSQSEALSENSDAPKPGNVSHVHNISDHRTQTPSSEIVKAHGCHKEHW